MSMIGSTSLWHFVQHDPESSAVSATSTGSLSADTSATLSMHCTGCASAVFGAAGSSPSGYSAPPRSQPTASHDLVHVVHLWNLDSLLSHPQPRLGCCCRQRRTIVCSFLVVTSRRCVLSWRPASRTKECEILFSTVSSTNLRIWTVVAAAASGWFCLVLVVAFNLACS